MTDRDEYVLACRWRWLPFRLHWMMHGRFRNLRPVLPGCMVTQATVDWLREVTEIGHG